MYFTNITFVRVFDFIPKNDYKKIILFLIQIHQLKEDVLARAMAYSDQKTKDSFIIVFTNEVQVCIYFAYT